ncbi:MAG: DUF3108 domain-containing protein [Methylophilus sp.]|nr:DUF3108 domain-containing protein [Methylophilus sp.]
MSELNTQLVKGWLSDQSLIRLVLAILLSALLHFLLIHQFHLLGLFDVKAKTHLIEARLVPSHPKVLPKDNLDKPSVPTKAEHIKKNRKKEVVTEPPPQPKPEQPALPPVSENTASVPADTEAPPPAEEPPQVATIAENELALPLEQVIEEPKPEPYVKVETDFNVYVNGENNRSGTAKITYDGFLADNHYQLKWEVNASGVLALFYPNLVQTSHGMLTERGLRPQRYVYQFGDKASKANIAEFDWSNLKAHLQSSKGEKTVEINESTQDFLSFMYQFMFEPPLNDMRVNMTNGKKVADYEYIFEGEDTLELNFGNIKVLHIKHFKAGTDEKTELWLAKDYHFVPVKIRKTEENGTVIEQIATSLKTETFIKETPLP